MSWTVEDLFEAEAALRCAASKYSSTCGMHLSEDRKNLRTAARKYAAIAAQVESRMADCEASP